MKAHLLAAYAIAVLPLLVTGFYSLIESAEIPEPTAGVLLCLDKTCSQLSHESLPERARLLQQSAALHLCNLILVNFDVGWMPIVGYQRKRRISSSSSFE